MLLDVGLTGSLGWILDWFGFGLHSSYNPLNTMMMISDTIHNPSPKLLQRFLYHPNEDKDTLQTSSWLRKLQRENPEEYKKVFKDFKDNVPAETGGRSKKRQGWKPQQLVVMKTHEATKQSRWSGNYEEMKMGRYLTYFTSECDPEDRMTDAEARIAWMKEPSKHKIKVYSHKHQKVVEVEVVSVETSRTRHQEQIGAEKQTSTQIVDQINNATETQIAAASAKVMNTLSEAFEDDMFSVFWL